MFDVKSAAIAAAATAFLGGPVLWKVAYDRGDAHGTKIERDNAREVVNAQLAETQKANAQIEKVNAAHNEQVERLVENFRLEGDARLAAQKSMETAVRASASNATKAFDTLATMRAQLQTVADSCARAGVDPSLIELFNNAIAASFEGPGSAMSSANRSSGQVLQKPSP